MKKTDSKKKRVIIFIAIILIMVMSFFFRLLVNVKVVSNMGDYYVDPETGMPYLTEMDSYYHMRMTRDVEEFGHAGEDIYNGEIWDTLSYAPLGRSAKAYQPLMSWIAVLIHRVGSVFSDVTLEQIAYWMGPIVSALVVIPVFLLTFNMQGMVAAVIAGVLAAINYGYFVHTVPGFFDTDMVIAWASGFMLYFGCMFIDAIGKDDHAGKRNFTGAAVYFVLFAVSAFLLMNSWYVYYMYFGLFVIAAVVFVVLKIVLTPKEKRRSEAKSCIPLIVFSVIMSIVIVVLNPEVFRNALRSLTSLFVSTGRGGIFPNAYVSISELRRPVLVAGGLSGLFQMKVLSGNDIGIINAVGGIVPFLAAVAMIVLFVRGIVKKDFDFKQIFLLIWFALTAVLAVRSWRFMMLFAMPVAINAGIFTGRICKLMSDNKMMDWKIFAGMIMALMLFPAIYGAYRSSADSIPSVNRGMAEPLVYIRNNTPENTVIASWWDYGYFIEEKAARRTLFDGGSQDGKRVYWVARAMATEDSVLSANIIKMLSRGGDGGTELMLETFGETKETLQLMNELLSGDKGLAVKILKEKNINEDRAFEIANLLFPDDDSPVMFMITQNMSGITGWFGQFGFEDDERYSDGGYAVLMDRVEYDESEGRSGWYVSANGEEIYVVIEKDGDSYRAYSSRNREDDGAQPYPIEQIVLRESDRLITVPMDGVDVQGENGYTLILEKYMNNSVVSLTSTLLYNSVYGRLYYAYGTGLDTYEYYPKAQGTSIFYNVK